MPSVTERQYSVGKIRQAGNTVRIARSVCLAATLPRPFSNADSGITANSPTTAGVRERENDDPPHFGAPAAIHFVIVQSSPAESGVGPRGIR